MPVVTLVNANTNYQLLALLYGPSGAVGSNLNSQGKENCAQLNLRSDTTNPASKVYVGDGSVSASNFDAGPLNPGDSFEFGPMRRNVISLVNKFLRSDTAGVKVDVLTVYA